ncbi:hypothetical protein [Parasedimentitalea psychrophila]|uniref:Uncharacterized protein n=1 Tax=Parasedimentitalea psychrophila TaxID=2997337 RepID=A0A9Y2KZC3_9RHOB|nr:hypothetical protein [Parasedimentitalea psychrophila]WIY24657.1 hypothetical protein QPJ95_19380 [Parasedimentitalea psychrophila]
MMRLSTKIRHSQLFELIRQKNAAEQVDMRLRVSRRSEGEGVDTLMFRTLAARSLQLPGNQGV